jgi:hypothetical protein
MRHELAAQFGKDGPWHYASVKEGKGGHPIGYCTDACTHETADEAREHYRHYVLDRLREFKGDSNTLHRCEALLELGNAHSRCEIFTADGLSEPDGYRMRYLCATHRDREAYEENFLPPGSIGEAWVS